MLSGAARWSNVQSGAGQHGDIQSGAGRQSDAHGEAVSRSAVLCRAEGQRDVLSLATSRVMSSVEQGGWDKVLAWLGAPSFKISLRGMHGQFLSRSLCWNSKRSIGQSSFLSRIDIRGRCKHCQYYNVIQVLNLTWRVTQCCAVADGFCSSVSLALP